MLRSIVMGKGEGCRYLDLMSGEGEVPKSDVQGKGEEACKR